MWVKVLAGSLTAVVLVGAGVLFTLHHECPSRCQGRAVCPVPTICRDDAITPVATAVDDDAVAAGMGTVAIAAHAKPTCAIHCCDE